MNNERRHMSDYRNRWHKLESALQSGKRRIAWLGNYIRYQGLDFWTARQYDRSTIEHTLCGRHSRLPSMPREDGHMANLLDSILESHRSQDDKVTDHSSSLIPVTGWNDNISWSPKASRSPIFQITLMKMIITTKTKGRGHQIGHFSLPLVP